MAAHARLKNELIEDEKCHNLVRGSYGIHVCLFQPTKPMSIRFTVVCGSVLLLLTGVHSFEHQSLKLDNGHYELKGKQLQASV